VGKFGLSSAEKEWDHSDENDENELEPTRTTTGWRVCIDYRRLNKVT
jgi:hypothetical protein